MGRKSFEAQGRLTAKIVADTYRRIGTISWTAAALKVSESTVRRYLRRAGVEVKRSPRAGTFRVHNREYNCLARYLREHPHELLPRSNKQIVALTGCTPDAIKSYLWRKRSELRRGLSQFGDLREANIKLRDLTGRVFSTRHLREYTALVERYTFMIRILGVLKPGGQKVVVRVSLKDFLEGVLNDKKSERPGDALARQAGISLLRAALWYGDLPHEAPPPGGVGPAHPGRRPGRGKGGPEGGNAPEGSGPEVPTE